MKHVSYYGLTYIKTGNVISLKDSKELTGDEVIVKDRAITRLLDKRKIKKTDGEYIEFDDISTILMRSTGIWSYSVFQDGEKVFFKADACTEYFYTSQLQEVYDVYHSLVMTGFNRCDAIVETLSRFKDFTYVQTDKNDEPICLFNVDYVLFFDSGIIYKRL